MEKTTFNVSRMDCASEEQLVRMKLEGLDNIESLRFDLPERTLDVYHTGGPEQIRAALDSLGLGASMLGTAPTDDELAEPDTAEERRLLWVVMAINGSLFAVELLIGFVASSMGLIADSLDMLADSLVYGLALFAVGGTVARKKSVAKASGYFQLALAAFGLVEVARRFLGYEETPVFQLMIAISVIALIGNAFALYLLRKGKTDEAHMQASVIFTSNDVIINIGVILAGVAVFFTGSKFPDLIVGMVVFLIVGRGALRILRIAK